MSSRHSSDEKPPSERLENKNDFAVHRHNVPSSPSDDTEAGLRIEDNNEGCEHEQDEEPRLTFRRFMSFVAMSFLWTASQIPIYLFGGIPPIVYGDIGGVDKWIWFITGNLLGSAAICPFSGALSDLLGRRYVAIGGMVAVILGQIICATARSMETFIAGMTISGIGAGINELTALAGTAELAPTSKRGFYVAVLIFTILPFCPSVMWAQLIAAHSSWRYVGVLTTVWAAIGLLCLMLFYFPPPRVNSRGLSRGEILERIDWVGGFLSVVGCVLFVAGLLFGGYQYEWSDPQTIAPLVIGIVLLAGFVCWEIWGAKYPMFPRRLGRATKDLTLTLIITFISGANFFSVLLIWPSQAHNVYGHDPVGVGIRGLPFAFAVMIGCCITLFLLSKLGGKPKWLLLASSVLMTAGCGSLAGARIDNIHTVYGLLFLAGLGVGGIVVPASILSTILSPDDLIATVAALTLAIRVVGGAFGYTVYYNVLTQRLVPNFVHYVGGTMVRNGVVDERVIEQVIKLTGASLTEPILAVLGGDVALWEQVVLAGQMAWAASYPWVYYCSIAFGGVSILASLFLGDISAYMDDHVAVVIA